jgi:hypothetical protein
MASASKRQDDHDADRTPVPPYPAEVDGTWQAFRVTLRDIGGADPNESAAESDAANGDASKGDDAQPDGPSDDAGSS